MTRSARDNHADTACKWMNSKYFVQCDVPSFNCNHICPFLKIFLWCLFKALNNTTLTRATSSFYFDKGQFSIKKHLRFFFPRYVSTQQLLLLVDQKIIEREAWFYTIFLDRGQGFQILKETKYFIFSATMCKVLY